MKTAGVWLWALCLEYKRERLSVVVVNNQIYPVVFTNEIRKRISRGPDGVTDTIASLRMCEEFKWTIHHEKRHKPTEFIFMNADIYSTYMHIQVCLHLYRQHFCQITS